MSKKQHIESFSTAPSYKNTHKIESVVRESCAIYRLNLKTKKYVYITEEIQNITGYTSEDFIKMTLDKIILNKENICRDKIKSKKIFTR